MIFARPRFNQFCLSVYFAVVLFAGNPTTVCAHVYADGFVERSLTITIRDGIGYGEYQLGLNANTADQIIELAKQAKQKSVRPESSTKPPTASDLGGRSKPEQSVPTKSLDAANADKPDGLQTPELKNSDAKAHAALKLADSPPQPDTVGSGEHLTDLATIARFGDLRQQWFTDHLKLVIDGQAVELEKVSVEPAARHPYSVLVKFQFSLEKKKATEDPSAAVGEPKTDVKTDSPANRTVGLQVTDNLFAGHAGATRYALRARGSTMLLQSNVAPVLVRAERVEIEPKAAIKNVGSPTIEAKLTVGNK